jgi:hypothetical protein
MTVSSVKLEAVEFTHMLRLVSPFDTHSSSFRSPDILLMRAAKPPVRQLSISVELDGMQNMIGV